MVKGSMPYVQQKKGGHNGVNHSYDIHMAQGPLWRPSATDF